MRDDPYWTSRKNSLELIELYGEFILRFLMLDQCWHWINKLGIHGLNKTFDENNLDLMDLFNR